MTTAYQIDGGLFEVECPGCGFYIRRCTERGAVESSLDVHNCPEGRWSLRGQEQPRPGASTPPVPNF